jgi:hypothetical protein
MNPTFEAAELAEEILRAMEMGSRSRLREGLDRVEMLAHVMDLLPPADAEQVEVLGAIAGQLRVQVGISEVQVRLLRHFADSVRVCLT